MKRDVCCIIIGMVLAFSMFIGWTLIGTDVMGSQDVNAGTTSKVYVSDAILVDYYVSENYGDDCYGYTWVTDPLKNIKSNANMEEDQVYFVVYKNGELQHIGSFDRAYYTEAYLRG